MLIPEAPDKSSASELLNIIASRLPSKAARQIDKPLFLYGGGELGHMAIDFVRSIRVAPRALLDQRANSLEIDPTSGSFPLLLPSDVPMSERATSLLVICIATVPFDELAAMLTEQGWADVVHFYDVTQGYSEKYPLTNGWELETFDCDDVTATRQVLERWEDDVSRAHHLQFIAWHRLREDWKFAGATIDQKNRYFIPQVTAAMGGQPALLDLGAHHGDVARRFIKEAGGCFGHIWMVEPDPANAKCIEDWLANEASFTRERTTLLDCAVAERRGQRQFFGGAGYGSKLSALGDAPVEVVTVDELRLSPSMIKLHLEGGELDALRGSVETLQRCRPIVACTIYHNQAGVWEAPDWLMNTCNEIGEYSFFLRLHSWCGTGAVLYAVPVVR